MFRRFRRRDLNSARQMVSRAERDALDRAEELSRQAAEVLTLVRRRPDPQHQNTGATTPPPTRYAGPPETPETPETPGTPGPAGIGETSGPPESAGAPESSETNGTDGDGRTIEPPAAAREGGEGGTGPDDRIADRRRAAMADRAQIEEQLRAELATLAGVLDQTRLDLEELLTAGTVIDLRGTGQPTAVDDLPEVAGTHEAGVGRK